MNKEIFDYFNDSETIDSLPKYRKTPRVNCDRVKETDIKHGFAKMYYIDDKPYHLKRTLQDLSVGAIASSKMYKDLEITTPEIHLMTKQNAPNLFEYIKSKFRGEIPPIPTVTATKDVLRIPGYDCVLGSQIKNFLDIRENYGFFSKYKWQILYDKQLQQLFLKFMTPQCLQEYIRIFILDELRTDIDRHTDNFVLYRKHGSGRFEGVIPFDLENQRILVDKVASHNDFNSFLSEKYDTITPLYYYDDSNYESRVKDLIRYIERGVVDETTIDLIRKEVAYDMPKKILETCNNYYLKPYKNMTYDAYSRLWEYNRDTIGSVLGL